MPGKVCVECARQFTPKLKGRKQIYCQRKCSSKALRRKHVNTYRENQYRKTYGISLEQYNQLFVEQRGCCAICNRHQTELKKRLSVDHNHTTKKVRGLLCQKCNHAIGLMNDNPDLLNRAMEYVS